MWKSISIGSKIWFALGILIFGFFISMVFGFVFGQQTQFRLNRASASLFPAAKQSRMALTAFKDQIKLYKEAIQTGELFFIEEAQTSADIAQNAIYNITGLSGIEPKKIDNIRFTLDQLKDFSTTAEKKYSAMCQREKGVRDYKRINMIEGDLFNLGKQANELRTRLTFYSQMFTDDLNQELSAISELNKHQVFLNIIIFFCVVIVSVILISIIINHSISRPLEKTLLLENAIEKSVDGIAVLDSNGYLKLFNKAWGKMHGYEKSEIVGKRISDFYAEELPFIAADFSSSVLNKQTDNTIEILHKRKDGTTFPAMTTSSFFEDTNKKERNFINIARDITERKLAESALEEANRELEQLAIIDGLTHVANRRRFDEYISKEWDRMAREQKPFSLIMGDIDYFKFFNDTYGHQDGDDCLRAVADVIKKAARRPGDLAARYGGEEFAIILPDTNAGSAVKISENIRKGIELLKIPHAKSEVSQHVTMSFGVASIVPGQPDKYDSLVKNADKALYEAKIQGRNRTILNKECALTVL